MEDNTGLMTSEQEAIALREAPTALSTPFQMDPAQFRAGLELVAENRSTLIQWVRSNLVEGVDFGRIHVVKRDKCDKGKYCKIDSHFSKPSLWKPGAEKIAGLLNLIVLQPNFEAYENAVLEGRELKQVIIKTEVQNLQGQIIATGIGARSLTQDYGDLNKALKMASKSSYIDGVLKAGGLSEVFTLDIEDMVKEGRMDEGGAKEAPESEHRGESAPPPTDPAAITKPQVELILKLAKSHVWTIEEKDALVEPKVQQWSKQRGKEAIEKMQATIKERKAAESKKVKKATLKRLKGLTNVEDEDITEEAALKMIEDLTP